MGEPSELTRVPVFTRAYGKARDRPHNNQKRRREARALSRASGWSLTFDTEVVTADSMPVLAAAQQLRVGAFQVRQNGELREAGFFFDPLSLSACDRRTLRDVARQRRMTLYTVRDFIDAVFFPVLVDRHGTAITYNGAFDYSRLAIDHGPALSPSYVGGFWLAFSRDARRPHLQIRHLSGAEALIRFAQPDEQPTPRAMRRRGLKVPPFRGYFSDVRALAAALLEYRGDLRGLAELLETPTRKGEADFDEEHLTADFLNYAAGDPQVTWECYQELVVRYARLGLGTPLHRIYSAASIGKALLDELGIQPWRKLQPGFPDDVIGLELSSYFGGRSEVHLRRQLRRVLYADFLSMYPTCFVLLGLWRFLIAVGVTWRDATAEVGTLMETLTPEELQQPETWKHLLAIVQVDADDDLFPVRADYDNSGSPTIGLNYFSGEGQLVWYALPDVINAAIQTGKRPRIVQAIAFDAGPKQQSLRSVDLMGNPAYRVNPRDDDVLKRLVELRSELKRKARAVQRAGHGADAERLDGEQHALKIVANAMSYGIFVELNVAEFSAKRAIDVFGRDGEPYLWGSTSVETPGRFFHPLLATLLTSAARLLLGLAEHQIHLRGLDWVLTDTDSSLIARPSGMSDAEFVRRAKAVLDWFEPLKPYAIPEPMFKLEDANYRIDAAGNLTDELEPLYCFAVSDKRYDLVNLDADGHPILRKASAHGLGHLRPPYDADHAPASIPAPLVSYADLGVSRWQHDLWYRIVEAALDGHPEQVKLDDLPGFDAPAMTQYAATTPTVLHWFDAYNKDKPYREQIRPFGFLSAFQARRSTRQRFASPEESGVESELPDAPAVVAPYHKDPRQAARLAFDRNAGRPVPESELLTYAEVLAQYHLHPEAKFEGGDYLDSGPTRRRHVAPLGPIGNIGKEANLWEQQFYTGADLSAQVRYGQAPRDLDAYRQNIAKRIAAFPERAVAERADVSVGGVSNVRRGIGMPRFRTLQRIDRALRDLETAAEDHEVPAISAR